MAWSEPLQFLVDGDPVGKGRPRAALVGKRVRMYTPAKTTRYEARVRRAIPADAPPVVGMCRVTVDIVYRRPGRRPSHIPRPMWDAGLAYHVGKQDVDNVVKAVLDGLQMKHPSSGQRWLEETIADAVNDPAPRARRVKPSPGPALTVDVEPLRPMPVD